MGESSPIGTLFIVLILFVAIWKFQALTYIYNVSISDEGIDFILLSFIKIYSLPFSVIDYVEVTKGGYAFLFVFNFKNRLFHPTYLIRKKRGVFTTKILITPDSADAFDMHLMNAGVPLHRE
jgi:hypothetical protein